MAERDIIANLVVKGGEAFVQTVTQSAKAEEQLNKELNANTTAQQQNQKATLSARGELRKMREELIQLVRQGKINTAEYTKLKNEAGALADAIGDAGDEIRQAGSDTRGLDKAIRAATVLTGAFTAVQGAAALFGKDSENLQKSLLKVQAALSILNGLQAIQAELKREDSIFTLALVKAKALYTAAIAGATGATRAFTAALVATGIGAVVVAIGLLIANWDKLIAVLSKGEQRLKAINDAFDKSKIAADRASIAREQEIALLEAAGAAEDLLAQKRQVNSRARVEELRKELLGLFTLRQEEINRANAELFLFNAKEKRAAKVLKIEEDFQKRIQAVEDAIESQRVTFVAAGTALTNFQKKRGEEAQKAAEEAKKAAEAERKEFNELFDLLDELEKRYKTNLSNIAKAGQGVSTTGGIKDLGNLIAGLNAQLENLAPGDPRQAGIILLLREAQNQLEVLTKQLEKAKEEFTFKEPLIPEGTFGNTSENIEAQKQQLKGLGLFRANLIREQIQNTRDAGESTKALEEELFQANVQAANNIAAQGLDFFTKIQNARIAILDNKLNQGLISEEEYQRKVAEINRKQAVADKLKALFDIALNTAVGISAALRAVPPNPALAAVYAVLGGIQAAIVAATPIPRFFKGVKNFMGGLAWVGDGGKQEVVRTPSGELSLTPDKPTLTYLPKGSDVFKDVPTFQREAGLYNMRTPSLRSLPASEEARERKEMVKLLKKGNAKYDEVVNLLMQNNKNTRQSVNHLSELTKPKRFHRV
jgi:hypothetical protein